MELRPDALLAGILASLVFAGIHGLASITFRGNQLISGVAINFLAAGLTDRQIAEELYLSINTVKWYNRQLYSKLGVGRRGQAVARAQELGLL